MAKSEIKKCKQCGADITGTTICINCGAKVEKPIYKRTWVIVLSVFLFVVIAIAIGSDGDTQSNNTDNSTAEVKQEEQPQEKVETQESQERYYESVTIGQLSSALNANAARAQKLYKGKYIRITGPLGIIDSDSGFFQLDMPLDDNYNNFVCRVHKNKVSEKLLNFNKGQAITVLGQITDMGEMLGYEIEVDDIETPTVEYSHTEYSDDELCEMAVAYWRRKNGNSNRKICVEVTDSNANEATLHLYADNATATETLDWYYVNRKGIGSNFMEDRIDLSE